MRNVTRVIFHHSAGGTMVGAIAAMESKGCHYHRLIDQNGAVSKMRDYDQIAYHAGAAGNTGSIGICMIGDFRYTKPTRMQIGVAAELMFEIESIYGPVQYLNHRDVSATMCPVVDLASMIRDAVLSVKNNKETQKPREFDETEMAVIERGMELGIVSVNIEDFAIENLPVLEMCLNTYDILCHTLRGESDNMIEVMSKEIEKLKKEKRAKRNDKNCQVEV